MRLENLVGWILILGAAYFFWSPFRRAVNGWIVQLGDKVRHDADVPVKHVTPDTHITEDVALRMFEADYPNDPRSANGWHGLPMEIRQHYIKRALESLVGIEGKPYVAPTDDETQPRQRGFG